MRKYYFSITIGSILLVSIATLLVILLRPALQGATSIETRPTYNLILTKEDPATTSWIVTLRSHQRPKYVVSGEAAETANSLLQRLPWLLQPGVDTIIYDPGLAGPSVVDSMRQLLLEQSPHTVLVVHERGD